MEVENIVLVKYGPFNDAIWGSVDPNTGELNIYPAEYSNQIEIGYQSFLLDPNQKYVDLPEFYQSRVLFKNNNEFYQTTQNNGYRNVFREGLDSQDHLPDGQLTIMRTVKYQPKLSCWYLKRPKTTHIGFLVDTSGSMTGLYKNIVEKGIEEFLEKQKEVNNDIRFYGLTFSSSVTVHYDGENLKQLNNIRETFYKITPSGGTAFYDSLLETIRRISDRYREGDEVIICSMTDGYDNSSIQNHSFIKSTISRKRKEDWVFVLFGTNDLDINTVSDNLGLDRDATLTIGKTEETTRNAYQSLTQSVNRMRSGEDAKLSFTPLERNKSVN